ncbi:hypothetical protein C8Q75DRAFT_526964 [Abortiporus biennis]|nr:hypothetical protein C8Q75DRAFT_526964 [Abortiporus biennis]
MSERVQSDSHQSPKSVVSETTHLSFPSAATVSTSDTHPPPSTSQPRQLLKDRLYVGNLHPTVDEYTLLQIFSKYGKISKLDFLFHKTGPMKGKPRGYAFIEYSETEDAAKAVATAHDKLLRGRKLVVTYAHQAPIDESMAYGKVRRSNVETGKPTTLSLLKGAGSSRHNATEDKIAKMEAKLRQMEQSSINGGPSTKAHHSLPNKPTGVTSKHEQQPSQNKNKNTVIAATQSSSSSSPRTPSFTPKPAISPSHLSVSQSTMHPRKAQLTGVRIVKNQPK